MTPKISIKNSQQTNPNNPSDPLCLSYINSFKIDCFRRDPLEQNWYQNSKLDRFASGVLYLPSLPLVGCKSRSSKFTIVGHF